MTYYLVKLIITALVVVVVSEVAKKSTFVGAIIISIPLTSLLAFIWLYVDTKDEFVSNRNMRFKGSYFPCRMVLLFKIGLVIKILNKLFKSSVKLKFSITQRQNVVVLTN